MRAMSEVTSARERSSSRRRSPSSRASRRKPLHARSDSQTNESPSPTTPRKSHDEDLAQKDEGRRSRRDVFPRLPAQFLAPAASANIDIYEDSTASPVFNLLEAQSVQDTPPRDPRRSRLEKGKAKKHPSPEITPLTIDPVPAWNPPKLSIQTNSFHPSPTLSPSSLVSLRRAQLEELDAAARREEELRRAQLTSRSGARSVKSIGSLRSGPSSPKDDAAAQFHDKAFLDRYQSLVLHHFKGDSQEVSSAAMAHFRSKSQQSLMQSARPRSRSSGHPTASRPTSANASRPTSRRSRAEDQQVVPGSPSIQSLRDGASDEFEADASQPLERPRSVSMPAHEKDAMIEALLSDGIEIQYPVLHKPSVTSMRSETSSVRRAYPQPLRLVRKRGDPQLSSTAGRMGNNGSNFERSKRLPHHRLTRESPSLASLAIPENTSATYAFEFDDCPDLTLPAIEDARSSGFTDELGDTLGELTTRHMLRQQHSMNRISWASFSHQSGQDYPESRPTTSGSDASSRLFFYQFGNNSRVAWAQAYYSGDGRLSIETPSFTETSLAPMSPASPLIRASGSITTPGQGSWAGSLSRTPGSWTTITGRSSSPSSSRCPDDIYIPRLRPMIHRDTSSVVMSVNEDETDEDPLEGPSYLVSYAASDRRPSIDEMSEPSPQRPNSWHGSDHRAQLAQGTLGRHRLDPPFNPMRMPEIPRLPLDKRNRNTLQSWKAPSLDDTQNPLSPINRQFWLLIVGFIFPISWMIGAILPIPGRPQARQEDVSIKSQDAQLEAGLTELWELRELRRWKKAQRWRVYNRFMSIVGVAVIAVVIVFAVIGAHA